MKFSNLKRIILSSFATIDDLIKGCMIDTPRSKETGIHKQPKNGLLQAQSKRPYPVGQGKRPTFRLLSEEYSLHH